MFNRKPRPESLRVAVLGVGPSGVFAALALKDAGVQDVTLMARKLQRSAMHGAQYLHEPIPGTIGAMTPGEQVSYNLLGTSEGYRTRVYDGTLPDGMAVSADSLVGTASCWDIRAAYQEAWHDTTGSCEFVEHNATPSSIVALAGQYDLVLSTVPAPSLCKRGCTFASQEIWAAGEAPEIGIRLSYNCDGMSVFCNGLSAKDGPSWYRISNMYNRKTVEWPGGADKPPIPSAARVHKPLFNNCMCLPPNVIRIGRYGAWQKGILAHHAYSQAEATVKEASR